ncbi:MAG TPA: MATE family efflux transporter [Candidatus Babeliales bacterium]|jgi:putative MATE family efflux protein|nr:MATE family efflux transporter [Candidatus Babeliales bacterium]
MRQGLLSSFITGVREVKGESYKSIFCYFGPEFITNLMVYSLPILLDAWFIGALQSTRTYVALGATNTVLNLVTKIAEAFAVGTVVLVGVHNGAGDYENAGRALRNSFWTTCIIGICIASFLWIFASDIYSWYGLEQDVVDLSIPFMHLRAISVFLMFVYFSFVGFLRGIKDTKTPMFIYILGIFFFVAFDYVLIFGEFGFPALGLQGSAIASIIQNGVMLIAVIAHMFLHPANGPYGIALFSSLGKPSEILRLIKVSVPIILDKAIVAIAYIWLCKMMSPVGTTGVAAFCVVKDMERIAILPAIACAQVITFLVSNSIGARHWESIKTNIKKILLIALVGVSCILCLLMISPQSIVFLFDRKGEFTGLAVRTFPLLSLLMFFDLLQIVLAAALRGAGDTRIVMLTRLCVCFGFFVPISWFLSHFPINNELLQFLLIYGSFYVGSAMMSLFYVYRFRSGDWKKTLVQEVS